MKQAQTDIMTNVLAVAFFLMFVFIGIAVYSAYKSGSSDTTVSEATSARAAEVTNTVLALPELRCSLNNAWERNCLDKTKIRLLSNSDYADMLGFARVTVKEYPLPEDQQPLVVYNNDLDSFRTREQTITPVNIYNPVSKEYGYGLLIVEVFS